LRLCGITGQGVAGPGLKGWARSRKSAPLLQGAKEINGCPAKGSKMNRLWAPWRMAYINMEPDTKKVKGCVFCGKTAEGDDAANLILHRGARAFVLLNLYPYNNGHLMVAPYAHIASLGDLDDQTSLEMMNLLKHAEATLLQAYSPQGFNVGMNVGAAAGAGIADHLHMHIVPRWRGDTNFMPVIADVKVMPDSLAGVYEKLKAAWKDVGSCK
jgi:ATP adenylyltransferase